MSDAVNFYAHQLCVTAVGHARGKSLRPALVVSDLQLVDVAVGCGLVDAHQMPRGLVSDHLAVADFVDFHADLDGAFAWVQFHIGIHCMEYVV